MRAIVVDDQQLSLDILLLQINSLNYFEDVQSFTDPAEAVEYAKTHPIDIAFLDIVMDKIDGLTLAGAIRAYAPACYVIFTTASEDFALDAFKIHAAGYLVKPVTKESIKEQLDAIFIHQQVHPVTAAPAPARNLRAQCFGNFEAFDPKGSPLSFHYKKTKELFAYLVYKKSAVCTNAEIASVLYEDRDDSTALQSLIRNLIADLTKTLKDVGTPDVLYREHGGTAIVPEKLDCDYYDYLRDKSAATFHGEFMSQYEWAEDTTAYLSTH